MKYEFLKRLNAHIPRLRAWGVGCAYTQELLPDNRKKGDL